MVGFSNCSGGITNWIFAGLFLQQHLDFGSCNYGLERLWSNDGYCLAMEVLCWQSCGILKRNLELLTGQKKQTIHPACYSNSSFGIGWVLTAYIEKIKVASNHRYLIVGFGVVLFWAKTGKNQKWNNKKRFFIGYWTGFSPDSERQGMTMTATMLQGYIYKTQAASFRFSVDSANCWWQQLMGY